MNDLTRRPSARTALAPALLCLAASGAACAPGAGEEGGAPADPFAIQSAGTRALHTWYSPSRGDFYTTSDPAWVGAPGATRAPDYTFVRVEGRALAAQEPGTRPLYQWWSAARGDHFLTTNPAWAGRAGDARDGYAFVRVEGYAYAGPVAGTLPLSLHWNGAAADNYTTAHPRTVALPALRPGYLDGATQGHVLAPPDPIGATPADFGHGAMRAGGVAAVGARPLLLVMVEFRDQRFAAADTCAARRAAFFGPSSPNVAGYFRENSNGRFTYADAGCVGPLLARDLASTAVDDATYAGAMEPRNEGLEGEGREVLGDALARAAASVDLARFDVNRDGALTPDELTVVMVHPAPSDWRSRSGANRGFRSPRFTSAGRSLYAAGRAAFFAHAAGFATTVHEVSHTLGTLDLYGSGTHSEGLTLMSATATATASDPRTYHLDPWHKIQLGWVTPRVRPITDEGGVLALAAPQSTAADWADARRPVILYDPRRGLQEYFIVEHRSRTTAAGGGYDAGLSDWRGSARGVAVWHVMADAAHQPLLLPGLAIVGGDNEVIDSAVAGDDLRQDLDGDGRFDAITPGWDRVLQSARGGDDLPVWDRMVTVRGVTDPGSPVARGNRGFSGLLRPDDGDYALAWNDGSAALRVRSSAPSADGARVSLEYARGARQLVPRLDSAPLTAAPGAALTLYGDLGVAQNGRVPALRSPAGLVPLAVSDWAPGATRVVIPAATAAGRYDLVVFNPSYIGVSNALQLDVTR
jgi:M6 family metalloprotease-like protein